MRARVALIHALTSDLTHPLRVLPKQVLANILLPYTSFDSLVKNLVELHCNHGIYGRCR